MLNKTLVIKLNYLFSYIICLYITANVCIYIYIKEWNPFFILFI